MPITPTSYETYFLQLVNQARVQAGVQPLTVDGELLSAARAHDAWMDQTDTFSHTGVNGSSPAQRVSNAGYGWTAVGENIAYVSGAMSEATVQKLFNNLMNSPGHRANILNGNFEEVGIGLQTGTINGYNVVFVTQNFGKPNAQERAEPNDVGTVVSSPAPTPEPTPVPTVPSPTPVTLVESGAPTRSYTGSSYNNTISGSSGNDLIDGRGGSDTMVGRGGDDTYRVNVSTDRVVEYAGEGVDTVLSTASNYTLAANVENLKLVGSGPQTGTGNSGNNVLWANNAADSTLNGGAGNDTLVVGNDTAVLFGGSGADAFVFKAAGTGSRIADFQAGIDDINLDAIAGAYAGSNPLADGRLVLRETSAATEIWWDADGSGGGAAVQVCTLDNVKVAQLNVLNDFIV